MNVLDKFIYGIGVWDWWEGAERVTDNDAVAFGTLRCVDF